MISPLLIPILGISCGLLAIFGGVFVKPWFAYRQRRMEIDAQLVAEKSAQYAAQNERLEQRVRVLERIVTDRGIGIPPEYHERVFERFFRVDKARSRATGGTGLGLAIVKHVAANHGGEVKLWSQPGIGSTFTLRVPRHGAGAAAGDEQAAPSSAAAPGRSESPDGVTAVETGGVR